jgi:cytidylate kinase
LKENHRGITIALDGYAACGKSTLARDLSEALGYTFIDTGAMYRAVTWYAVREQLAGAPSDDWAKDLSALPFTFQIEQGRLDIHYQGVSLMEAIRDPSVSARVSEIASLSAVRYWLVHRQQLLGAHGGVVLDGRDIGSVVFPGAELKLFVTASLEERTRRRHAELVANGFGSSIDEVANNLLERDRIDSTRADSPLVPSPGVLWVDTTRMTRVDQLEVVLTAARDLIRRRI